MPRIATASITSSSVKPRTGALLRSAPADIVHQAHVVPRLLRGAKDPHPHLVDVGEGRRQHLALPTQVRVALGPALLEVAAREAEVGKRADLRLGHHGARE